MDTDAALATHHRNTQHWLVLDPRSEDAKWSLSKFRGTSEYPVDVHRTPEVIVAANYPDCRLSVVGDSWVVLCGGLPYGYRGAFRTAVDSLGEAVSDFLGRSGSVEGLSKHLARVRGHFGLLVYDVAQQKQHVWNDAFGLMPIFHRRSHGVSTYWDCLLPPAKRKIRWQAVTHYVTMGTTIGTETFLEGIDNMGPGHHLEWELDGEGAGVIELPYVETFGGCEQLVDASGSEQPEDGETTGDATDVNNEQNSTEENILLPSKWPRRLYGSKFEVEAEEAQQRRLGKILEARPQEQHPGMSDQTAIQQEAVHCTKESLREAHKEGHLTGAALTGGGDTRLVLACSSQALRDQLTYSTHKTQATDWQIAHWLATRLRLKHDSFRPIRDADTHRSMLHEQVPLRRKPSGMAFPWNRKKRRAQEFLSNFLHHKVHGRFGTELMGFLCYDKTSVPYRSLGELEADRPRLQALLEASFSNSVVDQVQDPTESLRKTFASLQQEKSKLHGQFDPAFALQIQHCTRAFLCDIYGGLRRGSWFAIPCSFFVRNSYSPFLDANLLRLLLCRVPASSKTAGYQWYGELYQTQVPCIFREVPCNNKLLCMYASIPRAMKQPESPRSPYTPTRLAEKGEKCEWLEEVQRHMHPILWEATCLVARESPQPISISLGAEDPRQPIRSLVQAVGPQDAASIVGRLLSFLLWCEARL